MNDSSSDETVTDDYCFYNKMLLSNKITSKWIESSLCDTDDFQEFKERLLPIINNEYSVQVKELLDEADSKFNGCIPIYYFLELAIVFQSISIIHLIVKEYKLNINYKNYRVYKLAIKYSLVISFNWLLDNFGPPKDKVENGESVLLFAAKYNKMNVIFKLLNTKNKLEQECSVMQIVEYLRILNAEYTQNFINMFYMHDYVSLDTSIELNGLFRQPKELEELFESRLREDNSR